MFFCRKLQYTKFLTVEEKLSFQHLISNCNFDVTNARKKLFSL